MTVGDGAVGKTCLLMSYALNKFPEDYVPTVFDNYNTTVSFNPQITVNLGLWDTAGQEDYEQMRPLAYPGTHVFLICFSVVHRVSFQNVQENWIKEIQRFDEKVPVVLCGTKADLLDDAEVIRKIGERGEKHITKAEGQEMANSIGAMGYYECSGKTQKGMNEVFLKATEAALIYQGIIQPEVEQSNGQSKPPKGSSSKGGCCILQ